MKRMTNHTVDVNVEMCYALLVMSHMKGRFVWFYFWRATGFSREMVDYAINKGVKLIEVLVK
jgi:hypothetical protein